MMGIDYQDLEEMCATLGAMLRKSNERIRKTNGDITEGDLTFVDKLTHAIKSIQTSMAMIESEGYSYDSGNHNGGHSGNYSGYGHSRDMSGTSGRYSGDGRGRGRYAARDSQGRYSGSDDNSDEIIDRLREVLQDVRDDGTRRELERMISKIEG